MKKMLLALALFAATNAVGATAPDVHALLSTYAAKNEACHDDTHGEARMWKACYQRDAAGEELKAAGWCYGEDAQDEVSARWAKCKRAVSSR